MPWHLRCTCKTSEWIAVIAAAVGCTAHARICHCKLGNSIMSSALEFGKHKLAGTGSTGHCSRVDPPCAAHKAMCIDEPELHFPVHCSMPAGLLQAYCMGSVPIRVICTCLRQTMHVVAIAPVE